MSKPHRRRIAGAVTGALLTVALIPAAASGAWFAPKPVAEPPASLSTQDEIMTDVKNLVDLGPRRSGTPGGDRAAEYVKAGLGTAKIPRIWENNVTTYQWEETRSAVSIGGQQIDAFPSEHSFLGAADPTWTGSFSTGPKGRTAEVVDIGNGTALDLWGKDLRGKIVMFNLRFQLPLAALGLVSEHL